MRHPIPHSLRVIGWTFLFWVAVVAATVGMAVGSGCSGLVRVVARLASGEGFVRWLADRRRRPRGWVRSPWPGSCRQGRVGELRQAEAARDDHALHDAARIVQRRDRHDQPTAPNDWLTRASQERTQRDAEFRHRKAVLTQQAMAREAWRPQIEGLSR